MKVINASYEILTPLACIREQLKLIEKAGRVCYKSEDKITEESAGPFVDRICNTLHHESVIEHSTLSVRFIVDRGVSHEFVRHRLASFSQESTRYCNYSKGKFGTELTFIKPCFFEEGTDNYDTWYDACMIAESRYLALIEDGATAQEARSVLPNSLKTEIIVTANFREWKHIIKMRCSTSAHPQMREVMQPLADELNTWLPEIFN